MTRCRSTLEPWEDEPGDYHLVDGEPLLWLVDDDVIASIGLVQSAAPDGRTWPGIPVGGGSGSNGHARGSIDFVGHLYDDVTELRLEWPGRDRRSRLTIDLTWQHPDRAARSRTQPIDG